MAAGMKAARVALVVLAVPAAMAMVGFIGFWLGYGACACHDRFFDRSTYELLNASPHGVPERRSNGKHDEHGSAMGTVQPRQTAFWVGGFVLLGVGAAFALAYVHRTRRLTPGIPVSPSELSDKLAGQ